MNETSLGMLARVKEMKRKFYFSQYKHATDAQAGGRSVSELEEERDANLVAMLKALRKEDTAAGAFLNRLGAASA